MTDELTALRARVAELEGELATSRREAAGGQNRIDELEQFCRAGRTTPDPRDARIAVLEAALREARDAIQVWGSQANDYVQDKNDLAADIAAIDRALGDGHG